MEDQNSRKLINRGNNFAIVVFITAVAISLIVEIVMETELADKADDIIIVVLAIILLLWYFSKNNKFKSSAVPMIITILIFATKIVAMFIEFDDVQSVGDEFGLLLPLAFLVILSVSIYIISKRKTRKN